MYVLYLPFNIVIFIFLVFFFPFFSHVMHARHLHTFPPNPAPVSTPEHKIAKIKVKTNAKAKKRKKKRKEPIQKNRALDKQLKIDEGGIIRKVHKYNTMICNRSSGYWFQALSFRLNFLSFFQLACLVSLGDSDDVPLFILENHHITRDWFACIHISEHCLIERVNPIFKRSAKSGLFRRDKEKKGKKKKGKEENALYTHLFNPRPSQNHIKLILLRHIGLVRRRS